MLMSSAKLMMIMVNGKMMTPINRKVRMPDTSAPGSVVLYLRRKGQRMATTRKRPKGRRQDVAKRFLLEIRGHKQLRRQE